MSSTSSYYTTVQGTKVDRKLWEAALAAVQGQGDGRISRADAVRLVALVLDQGPGAAPVITEVEAATIRLIQETLRWTPAATKVFTQAIDAAEAPVEPVDEGGEGLQEAIRGVLERLGVPHLRASISASVALAQEQAHGGAPFLAALEQAVLCFLSDASRPESPLDLVTALIVHDGALEGMSDPKEATRSFLDRPESTLDLIKDSDYEDGAEDHDDYATPPPEGEGLDGRWIFHLYLPALSDHGYWAIVDRKGVEPPYCYGFN